MRVVLGLNLLNYTLENLNWGSEKARNDNSIPKPTQEELDEYFRVNQTAYNNAVSVGKRHIHQ